MVQALAISPAPVQAPPAIEVIAFPDGERHHVLEASAERLVIEFTARTSDRPHPLHVHDSADELLEVLGGRLRLTLDGRVHHLVPGDRIRIPRSVDHAWQVVSDGPLHARVTFTPGCNFHAFLRDRAALAAAGRTGLRDLALLQRRHGADVRATDRPRPVMGALVAVGAGLARLTGRELPLPELRA